MWVAVALLASASASMDFSASLNVTGTLRSELLTTQGVTAEEWAVLDTSLTADEVTSDEVSSGEVTLNSLSADRVLIEGDLLIVQASQTTSTAFIQLGRTLHSYSDFERGAEGWTGAHTEDCLGTHVQGSCTSPEVVKHFNLPQHSQLVIEASFHMLGEWLNDSAFLKVDGQPVWMENGRTSSIKTCREGFDARLGVPISVTLPHTAATAEVVFGSTLESCSGGFSVDEVRVSVS
jgi:hypothetical protein